MTAFAAFDGHRGLLLSAAALFLLLAVAYVFSIDIRASRGASITGDEPFYLLTTQSLLQDGDLDLANQYDARTYEDFFDHHDELWKQSAPLPDGRLLSPHNPGLSVLLIPGFALGGLIGAQVQLLIMAAAAMTLAYLLAARLCRNRLICWAATLAVGLSATAFIYSTEVYPEFPAALALVACLLIVTRQAKMSVAEAVWLAAGLTAICWLGVKYVPLALLVAAYFIWKADTRGRVVLSALGVVSGGIFIGFHLVTFDSLTPYNVNVVYAGLSSVQLVDQHVEFADRVYRLWGLFIDQRFGIGRWTPIFLVAAPALALLLTGDDRRRIVLGLVAAQILIAVFVAITLMGWWFPGRTMLTVIPLLAIPVALLAERSGPILRWSLLALALYGLAVTAGLAYAGLTGEVTIAVDPFDMRFLPFSALSWAFPVYTHWDWHTWLTTCVWLAVAAASVWLIAARFRGDAREASK